MKILGLPFRAHFPLLICSFLYTSGLQAQNLLINLNSGNTETYALSEVESIKFSASSMLLSVADGTEVSWLIDSIASYSFDTTVSTGTALSNVADELLIYPNPASEFVNITFKGTEATPLSIEIMDLTGKRVASIFEGRHQQETRAIWNPKSEALAAGTYLCRITAGPKVIVKKIVVQ